MDDVSLIEGKPSTAGLSPAKLVEKFVALRELRASVREREKELTRQMEEIQARLQQTMFDLGTDSFRAGGYVAYQSELTSVSVVDPVEFLNHVRQAGSFDLLDVRPSKEATMAYLEAHHAMPPGVSVSRFVRVNVRKG